MECIKKQGCKALANQYQIGIALGQAKQATQIFLQVKFLRLTWKSK